MSHLLCHSAYSYAVQNVFVLPVNELSDVCFVVLLCVIVLSVIMPNVVAPSVAAASPPHPLALFAGNCQSSPPLLQNQSLHHQKKVFKKSRNESSTRCPHGPRGHPGWSWRRWPEEDLVRACGLRGRVRCLHQASIS
jgi:hypothetical protein